MQANHSLAINNVSQALAIIKEMGAEQALWPEDWRAAGRQVLQDILEQRMHDRIDRHLDELERLGLGHTDRRNGHYERHLLTELGDLLLTVPRTRQYNPVEIVQRYARRPAHIDRVILASFLLGLSTRKVAKALLPILGEKISASTVSRVARVLDRHVAAFHRRELKDQYRLLIFDGVVLKQRTGLGALKRVVLVALGIRSDGKKEIIDFRLAPAESEAAWESFLRALFERGLTGARAELSASDGGKGLRAALAIVYPHLPLQRCWAHKTRNLMDRLPKGKKGQAEREELKRDLHRISHAPNLRQARQAAHAFAHKWAARRPEAVQSLRADLDELLAFYHFPDDWWRRAARTTNAIERAFVEVRRRTRPMGVFSDRTSMERILFAVFEHHNQQQGIPTLIQLTQNS